MARANPGRLAAARIQLGVEDGLHAEALLDELAPSDARDRGLAHHLAFGLLRRQGAVDAALEPLLRRKVTRLDPPVRACLRLGAFELAEGRARAGAVVHQWVEATRALGARRATGLVNAVLRKRVGKPLEDDVLLDVPEWLRPRFAPWQDWLRRCRQPPPVSIALRAGREPDHPPGCVPVPRLAEDRPAPARMLRLPSQGGAIPALEGFSTGAWYVIDPSAAVVADMLHHHAPEGPVLAACAAPGGKSFRLADQGRSVLAVDLVPARLDRVGEGSRRLGLEVDRHVHDWLDGPHPTLGRFAGVLVDAPCTGLGVIRRHPEIRWRRRESDVPAMALRQLNILRAAAEHVDVDGVLGYSVCSPMPEEGRELVAALEGWTVVDAWSSTPPAGDEDAFQAFVLRRT